MNYKPIIFALDEILDELKSGEVVGNVRIDLFDTLKRLYMYSNWHLKQSVTFAFPSLFKEAGKDAMMEELSHGKSNILGTLISLLCDEKREIRDASSQSLGALSKVIGDNIFSFVLKNITGAMESNSESFVETWQGKEGYMIAIGYIVRNCRDISWDHFSSCVEILLEHCKHVKYGSYSVYIRRQAAKALGRIVDCGLCGEFLLKHRSEISEAQSSDEAVSYMEVLNQNRLGDAE